MISSFEAKFDSCPWVLNVMFSSVIFDVVCLVLIDVLTTGYNVFCSKLYLYFCRVIMLQGSSLLAREAILLCISIIWFALQIFSKDAEI